jgi:ABC-type lipoprotein release transport system permease subunit
VLGAAGLDGVALGWSTILLAAAMLTATVIPALRAARLDPMLVLRHD